MADTVVMTVAKDGKVYSTLLESSLTAKGGILSMFVRLRTPFWSEEPCPACGQPLDTTDPTFRLCAACVWEENIMFSSQIDPTFDTNVIWLAGFWPAFAKLYGWDPDDPEISKDDQRRHYEAIRENQLALAKEEPKRGHNSKRR